MSEHVGPRGEQLIVVGELCGAHGVRGEARLKAFNPDSTVFDSVAEVFLLDSEGSARIAGVDQLRRHGPGWLVKLAGVSSPEEARALTRTPVAVRESDLPRLRAGQFYCYQLVGLKAVDGSGVDLGIVAEVLNNAGNDVLVVTFEDGKERMIPMIDRMVGAVDLEKRTIVVHAIDGLVD